MVVDEVQPIRFARRGDSDHDAIVGARRLDDPGVRGKGEGGRRRSLDGRRAAGFAGGAVDDQRHQNGDADDDQQAHHHDEYLQGFHDRGSRFTVTTTRTDDDAAIADDEEFGNDEDAFETRTVLIPLENAGERLDKALGPITGLSRSRVQALAGDGLVLDAAGRAADLSRKVRGGEVFVLRVPAPVSAVPEPQDIPLMVVFEDDDILVIDKPAGMVVHPAAGNADGTLVNALLHHCGSSLSGIGGVRRPGIVHRLDKDTSGLMVVAKNDRAHRGLTAQFADRTLSRTYRALVWGVPTPGATRITGAVGRHPIDRKRMAVVERGGKPAATRRRVLRSWAGAVALVECLLETGRTHQIRVHMAHVGHPLVGDPVYGGRAGRPSGSAAKALPEGTRRALLDFPRQALHAVGLKLVHPSDGKEMTFGSPIPPDLAELLEFLDSGIMD